ncbi:hypothetical protein HMI54_015365 [Coelomomyces lativittatus]|nr:hypothetical protein HMI56_005252 [Coelomomyces lativittatus]KAJ1512901.1 hypothetical protein HMI54_015365 [Coelomomyces lativittatus]KAJ1513990.1 hypothetical protein HMI55_005061 [Coelomomyces lativittatus]
MPFPSRPLSGYQKDILKLYRDSLKCIRQKPKEHQKNWKLYLQMEREKNQTLLKETHMNPDVAEWILRQSKKKIEAYSKSNVISIQVPLAHTDNPTNTTEK